MKNLGLTLVLLGGCSWTVFDDLEDSTWVTSKEKPSNDSSNWAVAIQRGQLSGTGGRLVVMGANQSLYSELVVGSDGKISVPPTELQLNSQFGIGNLDPQPILLADPGGNDVALVTGSGSASIAVLRGAQGQLVVHQVFGPQVADAATYMTPPAPAAPMAQVLVAEGDTVYGAHFVNVPNPQPSCKLVDDAAGAAQVRALAALPVTGMTTDVLVWAASGKLMRFAPTVFTGAPMAACTGAGVAPTATGTTTFMPAKGSQILTFDSGGTQYAVLQGHTDTGTGFLGLFDATTLMPIGSPRSEAGVKTAALFELGGKRYVIAGYPTAIVEGTSDAGQVQVFEIDLANGLTGPVLTLADANPEGDQAFGRTVTAMPFDGKQLIVVGADNEVFTYFRTSLYDETRAGR